MTYDEIRKIIAETIEQIDDTDNEEVKQILIQHLQVMLDFEQSSVRLCIME